MDQQISTLVTLISQLGFPIVVSLLLMLYIYRITNPLLTSVQTLSDRMAALEQTIQHLADQIGKNGKP